MQRHVAEDIYVRQPPACQLLTLAIVGGVFSTWGEACSPGREELREGEKGDRGDFGARFSQSGTVLHNFAGINWGLLGGFGAIAG
jgi:hypothetical protein